MIVNLVSTEANLKQSSQVEEGTSGKSKSLSEGNRVKECVWKMMQSPVQKRRKKDDPDNVI